MPRALTLFAFRRFGDRLRRAVVGLAGRPAGAVGRGTHQREFQKQPSRYSLRPVRAGGQPEAVDAAAIGLFLPYGSMHAAGLVTAKVSSAVMAAAQPRPMRPPVGDCGCFVAGSGRYGGWRWSITGRQPAAIRAAKRMISVTEAIWRRQLWRDDWCWLWLFGVGCAISARTMLRVHRV